MKQSTSQLQTSMDSKFSEFQESQQKFQEAQEAQAREMRDYVQAQNDALMDQLTRQIAALQASSSAAMSSSSAGRPLPTPANSGRGNANDPSDDDKIKARPKLEVLTNDPWDVVTWIQDLDAVCAYTHSGYVQEAVRLSLPSYMRTLLHARGVSLSDIAGIKAFLVEEYVVSRLKPWASKRLATRKSKDVSYLTHIQFHRDVHRRLAYYGCSEFSKEEQLRLFLNSLPLAVKRVVADVHANTLDGLIVKMQALSKSEERMGEADLFPTAPQSLKPRSLLRSSLVHKLFQPTTLTTLSLM